MKNLITITVLLLSLSLSAHDLSGHYEIDGYCSFKAAYTLPTHPDINSDKSELVLPIYDIDGPGSALEGIQLSEVNNYSSDFFLNIDEVSKVVKVTLDTYRGPMQEFIYQKEDVPGDDLSSVKVAISQNRALIKLYRGFPGMSERSTIKIERTKTGISYTATIEVLKLIPIGYLMDIRPKETVKCNLIKVHN